MSRNLQSGAELGLVPRHMVIGDVVSNWKLTEYLHPKPSALAAGIKLS